jgi:ketosteroid isomerase-like protein
MISGNFLFRVLFMAALLSVAVVASAEDSDEASIRSVRFLSNSAIKNRDLDALKNAWLPDLHVTTSTGLVASSADEMAQLFTKSFADPNFITYTRFPVGINLSPGETFAAESGTWVGSWRNGDREMSVEGIYLAQWHKVEVGWRIRSELYVALSCEGSEKCQALP